MEGKYFFRTKVNFFSVFFRPSCFWRKVLNLYFNGIQNSLQNSVQISNWNKKEDGVFLLLFQFRKMQKDDNDIYNLYLKYFLLSALV